MFSSATTAIELAIGLVGGMTLFLGLMRVAEDAGLVRVLARALRPVFRFLFPDVPRDHPALGAIAMNFGANMLGLGDAATPFGIKAMEELQKLNKSEDTATNSMVMMLALSTASVQLVPPVLLLALLGLQINRLVFPIIVTGLMGLVIAIVSAKLLGRLPGYRATDPNR
jgi:spore maturation protein A